MFDFVRRLLLALGIILAMPFWAYGVVGLIRYLGLNEPLRLYLGLAISLDPVKSIVQIMIGFLFIISLRVVVGRIK